MIGTSVTFFLNIAPPFEVCNFILSETVTDGEKK